MPEERMLANTGLTDEYSAKYLDEDVRSKSVLMERSYLKGWTTFAERVATLKPFLAEMITDTHKDDLNGQLKSLAALSACKLQAPELRDVVIKNCNRMIGAGAAGVHSDTAIDALSGLAGSSHRPQGHEAVVDFLTQSILDVERLSFNRALDLLHALSMGDFHQVGHGKALMQKLVARIDGLDFSQTSAELNFAEYE